MSTNDKKRKDNIGQNIKKFYQEMLNNKCGVTDIIKGIVKKKWDEADVFFAIGVQIGDYFSYMGKSKKMENINLSQLEK